MFIDQQSRQIFSHNFERFNIHISDLVRSRSWLHDFETFKSATWRLPGLLQILMFLEICTLKDLTKRIVIFLFRRLSVTEGYPDSGRFSNKVVFFEMICNLFHEFTFTFHEIFWNFSFSFRRHSGCYVFSAYARSLDKVVGEAAYPTTLSGRRTKRRRAFCFSLAHFSGRGKK